MQGPERVESVTHLVCETDPYKRTHHMVPVFKAGASTATCAYCGLSQSDIWNNHTEKGVSNG